MAYGVLAVNYGSGEIADAARSAATQFDDAESHVVNVSNKITSIGEHSGHGYVSSASAFLKKKAEQYDTKAKKLVSFAGRVDTVMSNAENADKRVATHLDQSYKSFQNITGLQGGFFATLGNLLEGLADFMGGLGRVLLYMLPIVGTALLIIDVVSIIKNWYSQLSDGVKYAIKAALKFIKAVFAACMSFIAYDALVAAIAALTVTTGPGAVVLAAIGLVGATITAATAVIDFIKASNVAVTYNQIGAEVAKLYDEMTTANYVGMLTHDWWSWDAHTVSSWYTVIKVVGITCSFIKGISSLVEAVGENGGLLSGGWQEFKDGFFNAEKWEMGNFDFEVMKWGAEQFGLKFVLTAPINDIIKGAKEMYGLIELGLNLIVFEPWDGMGEFALEEIVKNIPGIGDLYKGGKEIVSAFDNSYQLVNI